MPNIKSAVKRVKTSEKKNLINRSVKSEIATAKKKFLKAVENKQLTEATTLLSQVVSLLDSAAQNKVISKNCASRNQATLSSKLNAIKA